MSKSDKKRQREAAIKAELQRRLQSRIDTLPCSKEEFLKLFEAVCKDVVTDGHENDFSIVQKHCIALGISFDDIFAFLESNQIFDDYSFLLEGDPFELVGQIGDRTQFSEFSSEELDNLIEYLEETISDNGCDHTYKFTRIWLSDKTSHEELVLAFFMSHGGFCDCEVMFNVDVD